MFRDKIDYPDCEMSKINAAAFKLAVDPEQGVWTLSGRAGSVRSRLGVTYTTDGRKYQSNSLAWRLHQAAGGDHDRIESIHGPVGQIALEGLLDPHGLRVEIRFFLSQEQPLLLWKVILHNEGPATVFLDAIEMLNAGGQSGQPAQAPRTAGSGGLLF